MNSAETLLRTAAGTVRGSVVDSVRRFLGVPYGAADRFQSPRPAPTWSGERDATSYGPSAWQLPGSVAVLAPWGITPEASMDEECLVLNVWAPEHVSEPLPVVVFLHGGGHSMGSGSAPAYDGARVARRGDAIVVTINHRLGLLGYLYLAEVSDERFGTSGINGILDIVEALRWIHDHIALLGGDPARVLVYGQSGGGAKTAALLSVPSSAGLFRAAGMMSASTTRLQSPTDASDQAGRLLHHLDMSARDVDALLRMPAGALLDAHLAVADPLSGFQPVLDGTWAVEHPVDAVAGSRSDIPMLIGSTRDEFATFAPAASIPEDANDTWLAERLTPLVGDAATSLIDAYRTRRPDAGVYELLVAIATDARFRTGALRLAEARAASTGAPLWMYRFDWRAATPPFEGLAPHGIDTPCYLDNASTAPVLDGRPGVEELASAVSHAVVALAASGTPADAGLPAWDRYALETRQTMIFDAPCRVVADPDRETREIWSIPE